MSGHAPFPPSAAKRWMTCTASFGLGLLAPPEVESEYAAEGTRLHDVAAAVLDGSGDDAKLISRADAEALKPYLEYAIKRMKQSTEYRIEVRAEHSQLLSGTADLMLLYNDPPMLEVVDLKNGAGIVVDPIENEQLLTYAYICLAQQISVGNPVPVRVRLTIVQPPDEANPVKSWVTTADHVMAHGEKVEEAIQTAIEGRGTFVPGDHCRFCRAKSICPALRGEMVEALGSALPATMTPAALATWLDRADRMEAFIKALREVGHDVATLALRQDKPGIPGWGLKPKRATRQWSDEDKVLEIARRRRIKIWQDKLLSPAMAEKAHPNMPEELREQIVAVSSGMNLVRLSAAEAAASKVKLPDEATKMERMMANMSLVKLRK